MISSDPGTLLDADVLRWGLLSGERPPLPWEFFVSIGGALLLAGPVFVAVAYPWWSSLPVLGWLEVAISLVAGGGMVAAGVVRRNHGSRRP